MIGYRPVKEAIILDFGRFEKPLNFPEQVTKVRFFTAGNFSAIILINVRIRRQNLTN